MLCIPSDPTVCALLKIAGALQAHSDPWGDFFRGLTPVLVGAALALLGSWIVTRLQFKQQASSSYDERLVSALVDYMHALGDRLAIAVKTPNESIVDGGLAALMPRARELELRADTFWMVAKGNDIEVAKELKYALNRIDKKTDPLAQARDYRVSGQIIRAWRNEKQSHAKTIERLKTLSP